MGLKDVCSTTMVMTVAVGIMVTVVGVLIATGSLMCSASPLPVRVSAKASHRERLAAAHLLLQESPLIDGHNDLPWNLRKFLHNKLYSFNLSSDLTQERPWRNSPFSHTDLPRLRHGKVAAQFWSVYVPCQSQYKNSVQLLLEQIDVIKRMVAASPYETTLVTSSREILQEFKCGRVGSLLGVEGGHALASSMGVLRAMYDLGVRYVTLTHKCHTPWAECSESGDEVPPNAPGLTDYGKATNGGVVMISFYDDFLTCGGPATISNVVDHINHVRTMAGVDHVGLGAGYDGINSTPKGLEDTSRYPELFAELLKDPSWSIQDLKKLAGLNILRAMEKVEEVRDSLLLEPPAEDIIPIHDIETLWPCRYKFANLNNNENKASSFIDTPTSHSFQGNEALNS
ncbi:dipeptidase 1-like isoform X2 [Macrobrachium nipponense]|uniref:dipeptidase 1-like isoform X2 n=1 Tax=Macrobrachium nipponense TaxID=159736 RepID=UPI0030C7BC68